MLPIWAILLMHDDSCRQGTKDHTRMLHEQPARKQARCGHTCSQVSWPRNCPGFYNDLISFLRICLLGPMKEWILKLQVMIINTSLTTSSANASKKSPNVHNTSRNHPRPTPGKTVAAASPRCCSDLPSPDINFSSASVGTWAVGSRWQRPFPNPQPSNPAGHLLHLFRGWRLLVIDCLLGSWRMLTCQGIYWIQTSRSSWAKGCTVAVILWAMNLGYTATTEYV